MGDKFSAAGVEGHTQAFEQRRQDHQTLRQVASIEGLMTAGSTNSAVEIPRTCLGRTRSTIGAPAGRTEMMLLRSMTRSTLPATNAI
ncbi:hypothetical protein [Mycolicibacterium sp.]|uniref:hypothetical protein n=1 Tax=Mycolicibacterium sp. TaxID=2320850 RepID=UPI0037CA8202